MKIPFNLKLNFKLKFFLSLLGVILIFGYMLRWGSLANTEMKEVAEQFLTALSEQHYEAAFIHTSPSFKHNLNPAQIINLARIYQTNHEVNFESSGFKVEYNGEKSISGILTADDPKQQDIPITFKFSNHLDQFKIYSIYIDVNDLINNADNYPLLPPLTEQRLIKNTLTVIGMSLVNQQPNILYDFIYEPLRDFYSPEQVYQVIKPLEPYGETILEAAVMQPIFTEPSYIDQNGILNIHLTLTLNAKKFNVVLKYFLCDYDWKLIGYSFESVD
jgi:hypothetical protein